MKGRKSRIGKGQTQVSTLDAGGSTWVTETRSLGNVSEMCSLHAAERTTERKAKLVIISNGSEFRASSFDSLVFSVSPTMMPCALAKNGSHLSSDWVFTCFYSENGQRILFSQTKKSPSVYSQVAALFLSCKSVLIWLCIGLHLWDSLKWIVFPLWAVDSHRSIGGAAQPFPVSFRVKSAALCTNYPAVWLIWAFGVLLAYMKQAHLQVLFLEPL